MNSQLKSQQHKTHRNNTCHNNTCHNSIPSAFGPLQWLRRGLGAGMAAIAVAVTGSPAMAGGSIQVGPNFSDTLTHSGVATAGASHSCGEMSHTFTLNLASDHDSLRVRIDNGPLVLLVTGPGGEYCIKAVNGLAEMEGYWVGGQYQLQVGRRAGTSQDVPFNLTVSAQ